MAEPKNGGAAVMDAPPPSVTPFGSISAGDAADTTGTPLILNNAYFELTGVNLRCLVKHLEIAPEVKLVTVTTFCSETDYPGAVKWHLRVKFADSFDTAAVYATLSAARAAYETGGGTPAAFKARPKAQAVASATNPLIAGFCIPQPFVLLGGDAGTNAEVDIDWLCTAEPTVNTGAVVATGAVAGAPGYYTPSGATVPANLAGLVGVTASPASNWTTGQYIITADLLAANWTGAAWAAGKHA